MKNLNMVVHRKILFLGGFSKNLYVGGNCLKCMGAWTGCRFKSGFGKAHTT